MRGGPACPACRARGGGFSDPGLTLLILVTEGTSPTQKLQKIYIRTRRLSVESFCKEKLHLAHSDLRGRLWHYSDVSGFLGRVETPPLPQGAPSVQSLTRGFPSLLPIPVLRSQFRANPPSENCSRKESFCLSAFHFLLFISCSPVLAVC